MCLRLLNQIMREPRRTVANNEDGDACSSSSSGGPQDQRDRDSSPGAADVLVRVHAAAIACDQLEWLIDRLPAIVSCELTGIIVGTGEEVFALTRFDGMASRPVRGGARAEACEPEPRRGGRALHGRLSAWQSSFDHRRLGRIGHLAIQLARTWAPMPSRTGRQTLSSTAWAGACRPPARSPPCQPRGPGANYFVVEPNREQFGQLVLHAGACTCGVTRVWQTCDIPTR